MKPFTQLLAFALGSIISAHAQTTSFFPASDVSIGYHPTQIVSKDLNNDGKSDLIVIYGDIPQMGIFMNISEPGSTTASYGPKQTVSLSSFPFALIVEDFDADNKPDIVVSYLGGPYAISGFSNYTPTGSTTVSLGSRMDFSSAQSIRSFATGDFNNDGRLDLATVSTTNNYVTILLNSPISGYAGWYMNNGNWNIPVPPNTTAVGVADINKDGKPDIISCTSSGIISTSINYSMQGVYSISFSPYQSNSLGGAVFLNIATADMNNDDKTDIILSNNSGGAVSVIINNTIPGSPNTSYIAPQQLTCLSSPTVLSISDMNKDGKLDILALQPSISGNNICLFQNATNAGSSTISFNPRQDIGSTNGTNSITSGDMNNDGKADIGVCSSFGVMETMVNSTITGALLASFASHTELGTVTPVMGTTADLNNDGKADLITANSVSNYLSIFFNSTPAGNTNPVFNTPQILSGYSNPSVIAASDFTMDGKIDLLLINKADGLVRIITNTTSAGSSVFSSVTQTVNSVGNPIAAIIQDLNADGKPDIVVNSTNGGIYVFLNATTPGSGLSFTSAAWGVGGIAYSVALKDINLDGKPDIIAANYPANNINIYINNTAQGNPGFSFSNQPIIPTISNPHSIITADFNYDGKPDIAVSNNNTIAIHLNTTPFGNPNATFSARVEFNSTPGVVENSLINSDLNGDGLIDLAFANKANQFISVFQNNTVPGSSTVTFEPEQKFTTGTLPIFLFTSDINNDMKPDLLTVSNSDNAVSFLINTATTSLPVNYISFTGNKIGNKIVLQWKCSYEWDNSGFEIEKSTNGNNWNKIGFVPSAELGSIESSYSFSDFSPATGNNYYRLRQVDYTGDASYSKQVLVQFSTINDAILYTCSPNPFKQSVTIRYTLPSPLFVQVKVYNVAGKEIAILENAQKGKGEFSINWNAANMPDGIYIVQLTAGKFKVSEKIVKTN